MTKHTTPSTAVIEYDYDELNRRTGRRFLPPVAGQAAAPELDAEYSYDLGSRLTDADIAASGGAKNHFTYDALNRIDANTQILPVGTYLLDYDYDKVGSRTKVVYPSAKTIDYTYDETNRLTSIEPALSEVEGYLGSSIQYTYDPLDRRIQKEYLTSDVQRSTYTYDIADQLTSLTNALDSGVVISQYQYPLYDNVGNRKTMVAPSGMHDYSYNDIYELISVTGAQNHSFDYDNVGNRTTADGITYVSNELNQYTEVNSIAFYYDGNGNLIDDGINTYSYDETNRLTSIEPALSEVEGYLGSSIQYAYDALDRRVSKTVNGVTTYFICDGDREIAEYDSLGSLEAEYTYGAGIDEVLTLTTYDLLPATYYYFTDGLGSVTEITNETGEVVESYEYDVYGEPTIRDTPVLRSQTRLPSGGQAQEQFGVAGSSIGNPFMFTGRRFDEESGLYHYRARAYSPKIGRFLQRDPLGYTDSMSLFEYALNNPANFLDPTGKQCTTEQLTAIVVITAAVYTAYQGLKFVVTYFRNTLKELGGQDGFDNEGFEDLIQDALTSPLSPDLTPD